MNLEDQLSDITASLVALEKNNPFLERLFSLEMGSWADIITLCRGLDEIEAQLAGLRESLTEIPQVTWLDYPDSIYGPGYCLIIFFSSELHWHNIALYNQRQFLEKLNRRTGGIENTERDETDG